MVISTRVSSIWSSSHCRTRAQYIKRHLVLFHTQSLFWEIFLMWCLLQWFVNSPITKSVINAFINVNPIGLRVLKHRLFCSEHYLLLEKLRDILSTSFALMRRSLVLCLARISCSFRFWSVCPGTQSNEIMFLPPSLLGVTSHFQTVIELQSPRFEHFQSCFTIGAYLDCFVLELLCFHQSSTYSNITNFFWNIIVSFTRLTYHFAVGSELNISPY